MISAFEVSRRRFLGWAGAGAASLAIPGTAFGQAENKVTILQGSGSVLLGWAPSYLAEDLGYYKEAGIVIDRISNGSGPAGLTALVSGSGTFLLSAPGELIVAVARGLKLKILMAQSNYQAVAMVLSKDYAAKHGITADMPYEKRLEAAKNFKGIRSGISSPGSLTEFTLRGALKQVGLDAGVDAQMVPLGSVPNSMAAMSNGTVDAFTGASPAPEMAAVQLGAVIVFSNGKGEIPSLKPLSGHVTEARAADVEANPDLYAALVKADTRALRYIVEDRKGAGEMLKKTRYASVSDEIWSAVWEGTNSQFGTPYVTKEGVEAWITTGLTANITDPSGINLDEVIDMRFVDQAVKAIGWNVPS